MAGMPQLFALRHNSQRFCVPAVATLSGLLQKRHKSQMAARVLHK